MREMSCTTTPCSRAISLGQVSKRSPSSRPAVTESPMTVMDRPATGDSVGVTWYGSSTNAASSQTAAQASAVRRRHLVIELEANHARVTNIAMA